MITAQDLIDQYGEAAIVSMAKKMKREQKAKLREAKKLGHVCPNCGSSNIQRLERPIKWKTRRMTKVRCRVKRCRYKWTRYDYPDIKD